MWKFFTGITRRGDDDYGPVASETTLGWVLSGPVPTDKKPTLSSVAFIATHALRVAAEVPSETTSDELLHKLRDLESIGIGKDKESVHESFLKNVLFKDGRYHVDLPLKERHAFLPDNYDLSLARLNSVVRRLRRDPPMFQEYNRVIEEQLERGIIEKVDDTECQPPGQTQ